MASAGDENFFANARAAPVTCRYDAPSVVSHGIPCSECFAAAMPTPSGAAARSGPSPQGKSEDGRSSCSFLLPPDSTACDRAAPPAAESLSPDGRWVRREVFEHVRHKAKSDLVELESELMAIILSMEDAYRQLQQKAKQDLVELEEELMSCISSMESEGIRDSCTCGALENMVEGASGHISNVSNETSNVSHAVTDTAMSSPCSNSDLSAALPAASSSAESKRRGSPAFKQLSSLTQSISSKKAQLDHTRAAPAHPDQADGQLVTAEARYRFPLWSPMISPQFGSTHTPDGALRPPCEIDDHDRIERQFRLLEGCSTAPDNRLSLTPSPKAKAVGKQLHLHDEWKDMDVAVAHARIGELEEERSQMQARIVSLTLEQNSRAALERELAHAHAEIAAERGMTQLATASEELFAHDLELHSEETERMAAEKETMARQLEELQEERSQMQARIVSLTLEQNSRAALERELAHAHAEIAAERGMTQLATASEELFAHDLELHSEETERMAAEKETMARQLEELQEERSQMQARIVSLTLEQNSRAALERELAHAHAEIAASEDWQHRRTRLAKIVSLTAGLLAGSFANFAAQSYRAQPGLGHVDASCRRFPLQSLHKLSNLRAAPPLSDKPMGCKSCEAAMREARKQGVREELMKKEQVREAARRAVMPRTAHAQEDEMSRIEREMQMEEESEGLRRELAALRQKEMERNQQVLEEAEARLEERDIRNSLLVMELEVRCAVNPNELEQLLCLTRGWVGRSKCGSKETCCTSRNERH